MKLAGTTRVRNESGIIQNTLDYVAQFVDAIYVYDDASEDLTPQICEAHPKVMKVIRNNDWDPTPRGRAQAEGAPRQLLYELAVSDGADWVYCFDADEYVEPFVLDFDADAYYFRLFDFYITPSDIHSNYLTRKWMGPEYRDIPMMFAVSSKIRFTQRVPKGFGGDLRFGGYVRHYGKALTVDDWEMTRNYYINYRWKDRQPELRKRWEERGGKAVHTESDFGRPLITWEEKVFGDKIVKI